MDDKLFATLVDSVKEMKQIERGQRRPLREFGSRPADVRALRRKIGLSQAHFARLLDVKVGTLRTWEQGQRTPTGPTRVLLRAISRNPRDVIAAIGVVDPESLRSMAKPRSGKPTASKGRSAKLRGRAAPTVTFDPRKPRQRV